MLPAAQDTTPQLRSGIVNAIHQALVTGIGMPEDELFNIVHTYDPAHFCYSRSDAMKSAL